MERSEFVGKQNVEAPFQHYSALYERAEPLEIAARTGLTWDAGRGRFAVRLVGKLYYVDHPDFLVYDADMADDADTIDDADTAGDGVLRDAYDELFILRYLTEGRYVPETGGRLSYAELPWGSVYLTQFKGRVIGRLVREFGGDLARFKRAAEMMPGLVWEALGGCDAGYRFEFMTGYFLSILFWEGDEEFPASAQVLFDDNVRTAFTAEDLAAAGDIVIGRLKKNAGRAHA
ncbi:MAG: DUF3786 domain-containing protein [Clostridiales Family XIII bacterium]|jgi:hypothetical protein|nr:DUF3786 domain-containing protein [Clostridiales Family XIII bacterium]